MPLAPLQVSIYMCNEVMLAENEEFKCYSFCSLVHHKLDQKLLPKLINLLHVLPSQVLNTLKAFILSAAHQFYS